MTLFFTTQATLLNGPLIFKIISVLGLALCVLEGMRATADSISLERREGTLGLLLLTDLTGRQIVIGKVAAACVQSVITVLAMLPVFALPILVGGVTAGETWRIMLTFVLTLVFALAVSTFVSAWATQTLTALLVSFTLVVLLPGIPFAISLLPGVTAPEYFRWLAGPLEMFHDVTEKNFNPVSFWLAAAVAFVSSALMFTAAGRLLERNPRLEVSHQETWLQKILRAPAVRAESWGGATAQTNPAVWLASRTLPGQRMLWIVIGIGAACCFAIGVIARNEAAPLILICQIFFAYLVKLWLAAVAPQSFNLSRRNGALELLLCTPMSPKELVRGQVDALYNYFLAPALAITVALPIAGVGGMKLFPDGTGLPADTSWFAGGFFWFISFVLDLHALAYVGLWYGLTNSRIDRAIGKAIFSVLVLPWITIFVPILGCLGIVGWPVYWGAWASRKLEEPSNRGGEHAFRRYAEHLVAALDRETALSYAAREIFTSTVILCSVVPL